MLMSSNRLSGGWSRTAAGAAAAAAAARMIGVLLLICWSNAIMG
jgi:hypothetical protein